MKFFLFLSSPTLPSSLFLSFRNIYWRDLKRTCCARVGGGKNGTSQYKNTKTKQIQKQTKQNKTKQKTTNKPTTIMKHSNKLAHILLLLMDTKAHFKIHCFLKCYSIHLNDLSVLIQVNLAHSFHSPIFSFTKILLKFERHFYIKKVAKQTTFTWKQFFFTSMKTPPRLLKMDLTSVPVDFQKWNKSIFQGNNSVTFNLIRAENFAWLPGCI